MHIFLGICVLVEMGKIQGAHGRNGPGIHENQLYILRFPSEHVNPHHGFTCGGGQCKLCWVSREGRDTVTCALQTMRLVLSLRGPAGGPFPEVQVCFRGTLCLTGWWAGGNHLLYLATDPKTVPAGTDLQSSLWLLPELFPASCLSPTLDSQTSDVGVTQYVGVSKTQRVQYKATKLLSLLSSPGATLDLSLPHHSDSGLPPLLGLRPPVPNRTVSLPAWCPPGSP